MNRKAPIFRIVGICAVLLLVVGLSYRGYTQKLNEYATSSAFETLAEMAQQQKYNIVSELEADGRELANLALYAGMESDEGARKRGIERLRQHTHFDSLDFFDTAGQHSWGDNHALIMPKELLSNEGLLKKSVHYSLLLQDEAVILLSAPVLDAQGTRIGTLVGSHFVATISHGLLPFYKGEGYTYLLSENYDVIESSNSAARSARGNEFWEALHQAKHISGDTIERMEEKIAVGQSGYIAVELNGSIKYAYYEPVGISRWYLMTAVGQETISHRTDVAMLSALNMFIAIMLAVSLGASYMLWQQRRHEKALRRAAFYDEFCDCLNLSGFRLSVQKFMDEHPNELMLMIKLDIDRFKLVNQTLGSEMGDRILKNMSIALRKNTGGDERRFARAHDDTFYVLHRYKSQAELKALKEGFFRCFVSLMGSDFRYKIRFVSGTYYISLEDCTNAAEAIEKVTIAHRKAKDTKELLCTYDETFIQQALRKREIEDRMEEALEHGEFQVYLQAQNNLSTAAVTGAEALVRWHGAENLYPDEFIPIFEENNFILQLDMFVFEQVCQYIREWIDLGLAPVAVSVNFARNHLADPTFLKKLLSIAQRYRIPHHFLGIELTERVIAQDEYVSLPFMESLRKNGFAVSIDDFGTGYSSLGLLKNIPVDIIKLDKSFFDHADNEPRTQAVLTNVIRLAKDLKAITIAEGVETEKVANMLCTFGCDAAQGYYFARPVCEPEFRKLLIAGKQDDNLEQI